MRGRLLLLALFYVLQLKLLKNWLFAYFLALPGNLAVSTFKYAVLRIRTTESWGLLQHVVNGLLLQLPWHNLRGVRTAFSILRPVIRLLSSLQGIKAKPVFMPQIAQDIPAWKGYDLELASSRSSEGSADDAER